MLRFNESLFISKCKERIFLHFLQSKSGRRYLKLREIEVFLDQYCKAEDYYFPGKEKKDYINFRDWFRSYGFVPVLKFGPEPGLLTVYAITEARFGKQAFISNENQSAIKFSFEKAEPVSSGFILNLDLQVMDIKTNLIHEFSYDILVKTKDINRYDKGRDKFYQQSICRL